MKRTAEDAAKTRVALLEAALMSFEEKGWRGATFEHVAERAGVTRGALHHHFRSKRALLVEALEWGWSDYGQRLFADLGGDDVEAGTEDEIGDRPNRDIEELLLRFVRLVTGDPRFRALTSTTVLIAPQALEDRSGKDDALDGWRGRIETMIARRGGDGTRLAPADAAGLVLIVLQGFTVAAVTRPKDIPRPDELGTAITALVRGLLET